MFFLCVGPIHDRTTRVLFHFLTIFQFVFHVQMPERPLVAAIPALAGDLDAGRVGSNRQINLISEDSQEDNVSTGAPRVTVVSSPHPEEVITIPPTAQEAHTLQPPPKRSKSRGSSPRSVQRKMTKAKQNCVVS